MRRGALLCAVSGECEARFLFATRVYIGRICSQCKVGVVDGDGWNVGLAR